MSHDFLAASASAGLRWDLFFGLGLALFALLLPVFWVTRLSLRAPESKEGELSQELTSGSCAQQKAAKGKKKNKGKRQGEKARKARGAGGCSGGAPGGAALAGGRGGDGPGPDDDRDGDLSAAEANVSSGSDNETGAAGEKDAPAAPGYAWRQLLPTPKGGVDASEEAERGMLAGVTGGFKATNLACEDAETGSTADWGDEEDAVARDLKCTLQAVEATAVEATVAAKAEVVLELCSEVAVPSSAATPKQGVVEATAEPRESSWLTHSESRVYCRELLLAHRKPSSGTGALAAGLAPLPCSFRPPPGLEPPPGLQPPFHGFPVAPVVSLQTELPSLQPPPGLGWDETLPPLQAR